MAIISFLYTKAVRFGDTYFKYIISFSLPVQPVVLTKNCLPSNSCGNKLRDLQWQSHNFKTDYESTVILPPPLFM